MKVSVDASNSTLDASDYLAVQTRFEGQDLQHLKKGTSNAESITFSFFVRSSVASTYTLQLKDNDNTRQIAATYTINSANTWEYKTITFAGDTTGTFDDDNALSLQVIFWIDSGTTFTSGTLDTSWATQTNANRVDDTTGWLISSTPTFYITGIQFEVGEQATPFEHRSFGDELARCQRYFEKTADPSGGITDTSAGYVNRRDGTASTVARYYDIRYKVHKRAIPAVTTYDTNSPPNTGKLRLDATQNVGAVIFGSGTSGFNLYSNSSANHYGVQFGYYVDAEL